MRFFNTINTIICFCFFPSWISAQAIDTLDLNKDEEFQITTKDESDTDDYFSMGGAIRFNAFYKNWEGESANRQKGGDLDFDTWRISAKGEYSDIIFSSQYRFYPGYSFLQHGWIGYDFSESATLKVGLTKVPFGLLPYASHNWFEMISYYVGLEDDHDVGAKWVYDKDPWDIRLAFFKNSEGHFTGSSESSSRYSYDIVGQNEEVNQGNVRVAYTIGNTEIGISGQYGQLFNAQTSNMGYHYAAAAHIESNYGPLNIKAQALKYNYNPDQIAGNGSFVKMGAYDFPYRVAKRGQMYIGGISYQIPVNWDPINSLTFYNDFTYFDKLNDNYSDSRMNVLGVLFEAGSVYAYLDIASGQSHPWIGPVWSEALSRGPGANPESEDPEPEWATRVNLNIGYYF